MIKKIIIFFKNKKRYLKFSLIFSTLLTSCAKDYYSSTNIADYQSYIAKVSLANYWMPKLEEVGEFEEFLVTLRLSNDIFEDMTDSIGLFLKYDETNYKKEKAEIESAYHLLNNESQLPDNYNIPESDMTLYDYLETIKDFDAEINGYYIQVVYRDLTEVKYYEYWLNLELIGFNEKEQKICYLYHYNGGTVKIKNLDEFIVDRYNFPS